MGAITARAAVRTLRVAWTLSDLAGLDQPTADHVAAALEFRDRRPGVNPALGRCTPVRHYGADEQVDPNRLIPGVLVRR